MEAVSSQALPPNWDSVIAKLILNSNIDIVKVLTDGPMPAPPWMEPMVVS